MRTERRPPGASGAEALTRRGTAGLTLLEVLAAVALMGLVYTALASTANQGVLSEFDSLRRFQASLLADATLAQIETTAAMKESPELGKFEQESEDGLFRIETEVSPYTVPLPEDPEGTPRPSGRTESVLGGSELDSSALLEVRVRVTWEDLMGDRSIERITFVLDDTRIRELAPDDEAAGGGQ